MDLSSFPLLSYGGKRKKISKRRCAVSQMVVTEIKTEITASVSKSLGKPCTQGRDTRELHNSWMLASDHDQTHMSSWPGYIVLTRDLGDTTSLFKPPPFSKERETESIQFVSPMRRCSVDRASISKKAERYRECNTRRFQTPPPLANATVTLDF